MAAARAEEYEEVRRKAAEAGAASSSGDRVRTLRRLRKELRDIKRRDFFPPAERDVAVTAVSELAARARSDAPPAATPGAVPALAEGRRS